MIWFTSDLHIGHESVIKYCDRPFSSLSEMHIGLINNWNKVVHDTDIVYILGDVSLGSYSDFVNVISQMRGKKILIKGNHDKYSYGQYNKAGIQVFEELKLKMFGKVIRLSHFPYAIPWYKRLFAFKSELRFMDRRPPKLKGEILLHGHTHSKIKKYKDGRIHVGVDAWNYTPVSSQQLESLISKGN